MKKILFLFIASTISFGLYAQPLSKVSQSNIELAAIKTGVLLRRETKKVATFYDMDYIHLKVEDVVSKVKYSGIRIEYKYGKETETVFIDSDELKVLIKSVELVRDKRLDPIPNVNYKFMCRGGFDLEFGFEKEQWGVFINVGEGSKKRSIFFYEVVDILKLIKILNDANSII